jgi:hypothetical protein
MQPTEAYRSVQRGLVNAVGTGWVATSGFKLYEVTNFHLDAALGQGTDGAAVLAAYRAELRTLRSGK